jgi:hypothetical protein
MPAIAPRPVSAIRPRSAVLARSVLARSVLARSVLGRSVLASSGLACSVFAWSGLACSRLAWSLVVLRPATVPGAAVGSRSAVPAGESPLRPGPDDGSAGPQRCPATVPRRGARSRRSTRPHARLDRRSASAGSCLRLGRNFPVRQVACRAYGRWPAGRIDGSHRSSCPTRSCSTQGRAKRSGSAPNAAIRVQQKVARVTGRAGRPSVRGAGLPGCAISPRYRHRGLW